MQERAEHQRLVVRSAVAKKRGLVDHHLVVHPAVALGVPLRILRHVDERRELGRETQEPGRAQELRAERRLRALAKQLAPLLEHALGRELGRGRARRTDAEESSSARISKRAANCATRRPRSGSSPKCAGSVARSTPAARSRSPPCGSSRSPVSGSSPMLLIVRSRLRDAVAKSRPGSQRTSKPLWPVPVFESRRGREKSIAQPLHLQYAEGAADRDHLAEAREHALERFELETEDLDVEIRRLDAAKQVAHVPADQQRAASGFGHGARDFEHSRIHGGALSRRSGTSGSSRVRASARRAPRSSDRRVRSRRAR